MSFFYRTGILIFLSMSFAFSQNPTNGAKLHIESGVFASSSGKTPFLIRSNQYGTVPIENPIFTLRAGLIKEYDSTKTSSSHKLRKFSYGYGISAVANAGKANQFLLPEAYLKIRFGAFELYGGRRKEITGLVDTALTMGSYIWSGNALPIPKVQIGLPNYVSILGKGLFSVKGAFAHGWFENGPVQNFFLHQKHLYLRIGKPNWRVKLYAGGNHQVQWGGRPAEPFIDKKSGALITTYPSDFATYLKIISGLSINKGESSLNSNVPINEAWNRPGNHLGSFDIAAEINTRLFDVFLYRQSIYEDGSLFYLNNITDGLLGVSLRRKFVEKGITRVTFEYLDTRSQGGPTGSENTVPELRGMDNYFQNGTYTRGWTYYGNTIGTPLLVPLWTVNKEGLPAELVMQDDTYILNRVQAFSLGISGKAKNMDYYTKALYNINTGTYPFVLDRRQFALLCRVRYKLPKFSIVSSVSFDEGNLFTSTLGGYLGIQRTLF
ncbi:capsule assembly Wzi family protein [Emticicia fluvialis]|uniref:capsule assembly Wzi family protein n=1 Tax=Emticicia fluvialis TaxID=2974474 RepID=UPI002164F19F|nr:capsule assembly Wzi family protein [Emticicia fluvialis]